jgi:hypothetical protein
VENDSGALPYAPRPPLWRAPARPRSLFALVLAVPLTIAGASFALVFAEPLVLASPARATAVTVDAVESLAQGEHTEPRYRVRLPDGSSGRLSTPRVLQVGDRLTAMVSRGRITGRTFVTPPHSAPLPASDAR